MELSKLSQDLEAVGPLLANLGRTLERVEVRARHFEHQGRLMTRFEEIPDPKPDPTPAECLSAIRFWVGELERSMVRPLKMPTADEPSVYESLESVERWHVARVVADTRGNVTQAAARLGVTRPGLHVKLKALGVNPNDYR